MIPSGGNSTSICRNVQWKCASKELKTHMLLQKLIEFEMQFHDFHDYDTSCMVIWADLHASLIFPGMICENMKYETNYSTLHLGPRCHLLAVHNLIQFTELPAWWNQVQKVQLAYCKGNICNHTRLITRTFPA